MFFIGIFGFESAKKVLKDVHNIICEACGRYSYCVLEYYYDYFHIFFIPVIKWNKVWRIRFNCCGAVYTCDKETAKEITETGKIDFSKLKQEKTYKNESRHAGVKRCPACGAEVEERYPFCPYCGQRF